MAVIEFLTAPRDEALDFAWPAKAVLRELAPSTYSNGHALGKGKDANGHALKSSKKRT